MALWPPSARRSRAAQFAHPQRVDDRYTYRSVRGEEAWDWSGRWDSNPRSRAPKARALPTTPLPGRFVRGNRT